jgi:hypothetical protein
MASCIDLTDRLPPVPLDRLREDLRKLDNPEWLSRRDPALPDAWRAAPLRSLDGKMAGSEAYEPAPFSRIQATPLLAELPAFRDLLEAFQCPLGRVRLLRLAPGALIEAHRDIGPGVAHVAFDQVELHLPIWTHDQVRFQWGRRRLRMAAGRFYYADFTRRHFIRNEGAADWVHLVMDLKMNGWLRQVFPAVTPAERIQHFLVRATYPLWWKGLAVSAQAARWFRLSRSPS